ncbi:MULTISPECIES: hypothetical protein [Bacillus]|uniref:hypothetical protein n=1 Tax=Bacillus TaxID=1386 RepID=UPI00077AC765|nr:MULTISPECIES: hypothetical protein [Bacillus cereus group]KXY70684.1 hypothetical protein AT270_27190 [Bacillus cereus]MED2993807.1 hypothetical protein [Bacillus tropicus]
MNSELVKILEDGLAEIKSTESIEVIKPPKEVLDEQKTMIKRYNTETSQDDVITAIFDELKIGTAERTKTRDVVKMFRPNVTDYAELKGFIANLLGVKDVH